MDNQKSKIKEALIESINNYSIYKNNIQKIYLILKENQKYEKNILKYYNPEKDKQYFNLTFLFFFQHNKWINPYNIKIFPFEEHFKIIKNEFHDKIECLIINNIDNKKIMKLFIYWLIYLLNNLEEKIEINNNENTNKNQNNKYLIKDIRNILFQTNNKILNIYKYKKIDTDEIFIFLYIYLFFLEYNTKTLLHEKHLKIINSILFELFFDLLEKISINIISDNTDIEQAKNKFKIFMNFLDELKINPLIINDYNIIILLDSNIIQNFIKNILINIKPQIMEKIYPVFSDKFADFYSTFLKFRFIKGKTMDFFINNIKNGLINLNYFMEEKEKILNDIFIQNFQSNLIQKIINQENKKLEHPNLSSFLFNGNNSKISFKLGKTSLNDNMIIFAFQIKSNFNDNNVFNSKQTLFGFYSYYKELIFKLILKKIESDNDNIKKSSSKSNKLNNLTKNKKNQFLLNMIINNKNEEIDLNELDIIEPNLTYYICIYLNNSHFKLYLCSSKADSKILKVNKDVILNLIEDSIILNIGYDNYINQNENYSGYIGNFYIIKCNYKNKLDNDNIIQAILQLKDYYRYITYYLKDNSLKNKAEYNLYYLFFYKNKNEIFQFYKNLDIIENNTKITYENTLSIYPELFKLLNINEKDILSNYNIPKISGVCEKQSNYIFNEINITYVKYDFTKEVFLMKNGFNYFCLQFEYFFQFGKYYLLFMNKNQQQEIKENADINFYKNNKDIAIKLIKNSINNILILLTKYIVDFNINNFSTVLKQIFTSLLASMKTLNNFAIIIDPIFHQISGLYLIVDELLSENSNFFNLNNNKYLSDNQNKNEFLISFRDSLIDILLTKEFYLNAPSQILELLFQKLISIIEGNSKKDITTTNPNIFKKVLNLAFLMGDLFSNLECNLKNSFFELRNSKGNSMIILLYFKMIKGLILKNKNSSNKNNFLNQLFIFSIRDCRNNQSTSFLFLKFIYYMLKNEFSLDENEIEEMINYYEEIKNSEHKLDINSDENSEELRNNLSSIIIVIWIVSTLERNNKKTFMSLLKEIKQIEIDNDFFMLILNVITEIISKNFNSQKISVFNSENYMIFYEDIFEFILTLLNKKSNNIIKNEQEENKKDNKANSPQIVHSDRQERKYELINIIYLMKEIINSEISLNKKITISIIYCLINFVKFFHIIIFDNNLMDLFDNYKFLHIFFDILVLCLKTKIIYINIYIKLNEKSLSIYKTIPETILDICIKLITSDKLETDNNNSNEKLNKRKLIDLLYEIFLNEKKNPKKTSTKINENQKRTLFCYNDIYKYLLSKKFTNIQNDFKSLTKEKILKKYFPFGFEEEFLTMYRINLLLKEDKRFKCNFLTFNIEKICKFYLNIESSFSNNDELKKFLDNLLTKIIKEHEILYELDKKIYFRANTKYSKYISILKKIETFLSGKNFDDLKLREIIEKEFNEKTNVYEFVTSGLCEDINYSNNENKKIKYKNELNKSSIELGPKKLKSSKIKIPLFSSSITDISNDNFNISPPVYNNTVCNSERICSDNININNSRSNSFVSGSDDLVSSHTEDIQSQSETSSNNCILDYSPDNIDNKEQLSSPNHLPLTAKTTKPFTHIKSNSNFSLQTVLNTNGHMNINKNQTDGNSSNSNNIVYKKTLFEDINEINYCFFTKMDEMYLFNVKRDLMKNIFSVNFIDTIFYDKIFSDLKKIFLQNYGKKIELINQKNFYLNYPTKIKNFSNGIEPPLFIKPFNNFFNFKTFPITHEYFYNYIQAHKQKIKYQYINLFQKQIVIPNKQITHISSCELIKIEHAIYGNIIYSKNGNYLYFFQENFENIYNAKKNEIYYDGLFSLSMMKYKEKENEKNSTKFKHNKLFYENKTILIMVSEIEEIIERRFLLMWQGFEIYLKDGRSYFFNLLHESKYEQFKKFLLENNELKLLFHKKDYLSKHKLITDAWLENIISNYEFLLFINKYGSRSFNEPNQYYVFPWILTKLKNLIYINDNKEELYSSQRKLSLYKKSYKDKNEKEMDNNDFDIINSLRILKYPVSLQLENNRQAAMYRYSEEEENKFKFHCGTHYSTAPFVYYYLMRQEPYNTLLIKLQNYHQENPNRMFIGMKETVEILETGNDNRELIPEFFSKIEYFLNLNCAFYGYRANKQIVNNVNINFIKKDNSQILISDYVHLIFEHKKLLNSYLVSSNLNDWINNVFGVGQLPNEKIRKNCCNIFRKTTYEKKVNLLKKIDNYEKHINEKYDEFNFVTKIRNKIDLIISFGQTPYQVFKETIPRKLIDSLNNTKNNLGFNKKYSLNEDHNSDDDEEDILERFSERVLRPNSNQIKLKNPCIYFEINNNINKIFALTQNEEIFELNFKLNDEKNNQLLNFSLQNYFTIPHIKFLEKIKLKNDYHIYKPKYAFSSFPNDIEINNNALSRKSSALSKGSKDNKKNNNINYNFNKYYKDIFENMDMSRKKINKEETNEEIYKFITCRYLDNSFKLYKITKIRNPKKKDKEFTINSYSYICEDFVSSCCTISSNEFLIGLDNGKLIKWKIENEENSTIKLDFNKNIQAHKGRINAIEIDIRLGLIITCGNDNYVQIRKLYNFELLTPIKINKKYIITMAKVSNNNFLYIMCYNKIKKTSIIFGYTLTGIKFAKSPEGYFCNIDFTQSGNIVSLFNFNKIYVLNAYDLARKDINEEQPDFKDFYEEEKRLDGSVWMEFNYFRRENNNEDNNIIIYIKKGKKSEENLIFYHDFKKSKIFE